MKISVMIVDDEHLERILISKSYDWEDNGFKIVAEASNGEEAIKLFNEFNPQIVLTDINMPFMDGLILSQNIKELSPKTEIIIITGFGEFSYAQKAINIGVNSFILKPIDKNELKQVVEKSKQTVLAHTQSESNTKKLINSLEKNKQIVLESFLHRLLQGRVGSIEFIEKITELNLDWSDAYIICVNIKHGFQSSNYIINRIKEKFSTFSCTVFEHYSGSIIILINIKNDESGLYLRIKECLMNILNIESMFIAISNKHIGHNAATESYLQTVKIIARLEISNQYGIDIYNEKDLPQTSSVNYEYILKNYIESFKNGLFGDVNKYINDYISKIVNYTAEPLTMRLLILNIIFATSMIIWEYGHDISNIEGCKDIYINIANTTNISKQKEIIINFVQYTFDYYIKNCCLKNDSTIEKVITYINENYCNYTLSLKTIAREFFMNESYLSRIFKQSLNKNISEYICEKRMKKSAELLRSTNYKNYEISEMIGINDPHYFGQCFKKYMGITANEYRKKIKNIN